MATNYGAPTGLDLSACSVTATGGTASQSLADLGKAVGDNATAIAAASDSISTATQTATQASTDASAAKTAVANLGTTYIPASQKGQAGGVVTYDSTGAAIVQAINNGNAFLAVGDWPDGGNPNAGGCTVSYRFNGTVGSINYNKTNSLVYQLYSGFQVAVCPDVDGGFSLAEAGRAVSGVFSKTAVTVTSDANEKTVIGDLADTTYADGQKLAAAIFGIDTEMFKLNSSIATKGADAARLHSGFIAQKVEAALTAAGLDPHDYALWTESPVYETVKTDTGKINGNGEPIYTVTSVQKKDANGQPVTIQMLRYAQIFSILHAAYKAKVTSMEADIAAIKAKVGA